MAQDYEAQVAEDADQAETPSGAGGLIAIIIGILLGVLVGAFYGQQMWLAGGGPDLQIKRLEQTKEQKLQFAAATEDPAEAKRLQSHVPEIDKEIKRVAAQRDKAEPNPLAYAIWVGAKFCGDMFLQVLKLLVIPLVVTSMICGITALGDVRKLGKVGIWTLVYYLTTGAVAVLVGMILVQLIQPGIGTDDTFAYVTENVMAKERAGTLDTLLDVFRGREGEPHSGMFPSNIFLAASHTNVLALIAFALVFGAALTTVGKKGQVAIDFFNAANLAVMKMVHIVMWFAPVGIFGLVAFNIAKNGGGAQLGQQVTLLGKYVFTVAFGLLLHAVLLTLVLGVLARRNPFSYLYGVTRALLTAVTTASSSATLPVTMECVEENNRVSNRTAGFVLPLGATVNMDGTALYEAVAVIFIAQSLGVTLTVGALVVIFLTASLAAVGAAGIPEAGLVTMVIVLTAVGLPISGIGMILAIDWFLDRLRTTVNVYGDAVGAGVIDHFLTGRR